MFEASTRRTRAQGPFRRSGRYNVGSTYRRSDALVYQPFLLGEGRVHFSDARKGIETSEEVMLLAGLAEEVSEVDWYEAEAFSSTSLSRASSAIRGFGRSAKEAQDVVRAEEDLATLEARRRDMEAELEEEMEELEERFDALAEELEPLALKPRRADVEVQRVVLAWVPFRHGGGGLERAWP